MKSSKILVIFLFLFGMVEIDAWRRRRRRQCSPVPCAYQWGSWSPCSCNSNRRSRSMTITRHPSCGGAACPASTQTVACNGQCVAGNGACVGNTCKCNPGRTGTRCEAFCPSGSYGLNCAQKCSCMSGVQCDPTDGFCKCPVGRSGRYCQFHYKCQPGGHCFHMTNPVVNYKHCFVQIMVSSTPATATCPTPTHYVNKCSCYNNCIPVTMTSSRYCRCYCKAPLLSNVPAVFRGKYVTFATCCPLNPYF